MEEIDVDAIRWTVVWATFAIAVVVGAVMNRTNYCTMGAVSDVFNMGDWTRMRMWIGTIGIAIVGTQLLAYAGVIDPGKSLYAGPRFTWLSYIVGGLMFGFGMVLGSGCGSKTLIRIGAGSLKSLVVFLMLGLFAYMTLRGIFGVIRVSTVDAVSLTLPGGQDLPRLLARGDDGLERMLHLVLGLVIGIALLAFAFAGREFRRSDAWVGSVVVGLGVVAIWYVSGAIGYVEEHPQTLEETFVATNSGRMESLSFVAPVAYTLELLMFWSDKSKVVTVGIASALGLIVGSALYAILSRSFRWEGFHDAEDTATHMVGGALMGVGGVTALGCTIGQGMSGLSTLAIGSLIAFGSIVAGAWLGLKYQTWRVERSL